MHLQKEAFNTAALSHSICGFWFKVKIMFLDGVFPLMDSVFGFWFDINEVFEQVLAFLWVKKQK